VGAGADVVAGIEGAAVLFAGEAVGDVFAVIREPIL
jgi:hypothetical protein